MASSGSFNTTSYSNRHLVFAWSIQSQSVANNTTTIAWSLKGAGSATVYYMSGPFRVVIDGKTVYSSDSRIQLLNGTTVASGTATLSHDATGAKSFSASVQAAIYSASMNVSGSGSWSVDTIARASQPSLITWPETTNNVGNFGDTISIHMNRKSDSFTHTVRYEFGTRKGTIATGVTTGTTWIIPLDFINLLPTSLSGSGRVYVDTYNGSTLVGTKYTGFTATVPSSVRPSCSIQVLDATNYQATYGNLVKGLSKLYIKVTTTKAYGSDIAAYDVTADGKRYSTAEITTSVLSSAGTVTVKAKVTDKRGRTSQEASASFSVLDYNYPSISALSVLRSDANGTANEQGEYIKVTFSAAITALNNKNTAAYKLRYKKTSVTSFTEVTFTDLANKYSVANKSHVFAASGNDSFDVEIVATDKIRATTRATSASTAFTLISWGDDGTSIGFGKVAEEPNTMQIALDVEFLGKVKGTIFDAIYPVGSVYISYNHTNPANLFGGTWVRIENAFLWGVDSSGTIGQTGGSKTHTLTVNELPSHTHGSVYSGNAAGTKTHAWLASGGSAMAYGTVATGGGAAHNNMPPYVQVSIWRRTA